MRTAEFPLYIDTGNDDYGSWLTVMKQHKLVKSAGAWYTLTIVDKESGEITAEKQFKSKDFDDLMKSDEIREYCYDMICEACILQYDSKQLGVDDVIETKEVVDEI